MWNRKFKSLQLKIMLFGVFCVIMGVALYFLVQLCGERYIEKVYMSEEKAGKRMERLVNRYSSYVTKKHLNSDDYEEMKQWCKRQDNAYLMVFDGEGNLVFETDGTMSSVYQNGESGSIADPSDVYTVSFADGDYDISLIEFSEYEYYDLVKILGFVVALIGISVSLLMFSQTIIRKITLLSKEVREVQNGNLQKTVSIRSNDEIGQLGDAVNEMRISIINHYEEAEEAWKANKELLTSISHDIRTPLTSLIGFSEMMDDETDMENMKQYAKVCREKAYRIKELTDQLFRYFLVYGSAEMDACPEEYEAVTFLEQFLGEYAAILSISGYQVDFQNLEQTCVMKTDVTLLRRVFDNICSNIEKYADKKEQIGIRAYLENGNPVILLENVIDESLDAGESTHIGVKVCRKVMNTLGGNYESGEITRGKQRVYQSKVTMAASEKNT